MCFFKRVLRDRLSTIALNFYTQFLIFLYSTDESLDTIQGQIYIHFMHIFYIFNMLCYGMQF